MMDEARRLFLMDQLTRELQRKTEVEENIKDIMRKITEIDTQEAVRDPRQMLVE